MLVDKVVEVEVVREVVPTRDEGTDPAGRELARHTHEGEAYALVEYGDELAVFAASGLAVFNSSLASDVLRAYAWGQALEGLDIGSMAAGVGAVRRMDENMDVVREASNSMVLAFDRLDELSVQVPLLGKVSAMDALAEIYPSVATAAGAIRSLDDKLNSLGNNADVLRAAIRGISAADPSGVSGSDMDDLFASSARASRDMEASVRSARTKVADVRNMAGALENALRSASDTPTIGETMGEYAITAGRFESELSSLVDTLQSLENYLRDLTWQFQAPIDAVGSAHEAYVERWLQRPYDTSWRVDVGSRTRASEQPTPAQSNTQAAAPAASQLPFKLDWSTSVSGVKGRESFTLTVRMYDVQETGEHGGISVSFPSLTEPGGSNSRHSSSLADVHATEYTTGLSNVTFHQPGATIYHRENSRQFTAEYLLVESDDASWTRLDERTLELLITPRSGGMFPIQIRGWLCAHEYMDCSRNPGAGTATDQQGYGVEMATITLSGR